MGAALTTTPAKRSRARTWFFRLAAMTLVPAVLLVAVEGVLRVAGFGYPTDYFVRVRGREAWTSNMHFARRFMPPGLAREPTPVDVAEEKPPGTVRVVVLGGSAAQGTPEERFALGPILEVMLREACPDRRIEVVPTAMVAVNSHVVLPIARDAMKLDPDVLVVYLGNNEVVGPYGAGSVLAGYSPSLGAIRASIAVKSTRTGQAVSRLLTALAPEETGFAEWRGMQMFLENRVPRHDERLANVYDHFRANLEDVAALAEDGPAVVLCTVAVNLKDCPPFASVHRPDLSAEALARWAALYPKADAEAPLETLEAAAEIDHQYAELQFRLGRAYLARQETAKAREHFERARDLDALRFRADSQINAVIRAVAGQGGKVHLVDVERAFAGPNVSSSGIPGAEYFWEHVHLRFEGNWLVAREVFRVVQAIVPDADAGPALPAEACARALGMTARDRYTMAHEMMGMISKAPFTAQLGYDRLREGLKTEVDRWAAAVAAGFEGTEVQYRATAARRPNDFLLGMNLAQLLVHAEKYEEAVRYHETLLARLPDYYPCRLTYGVALMGAGREEEAAEAFQRTLEVAPTPVEACRTVGRFLTRQERYEEAVTWYRRGLEYEPDHAPTLDVLGQALLKLDRPEEAIPVLEKAVKAMPEAAPPRYHLAMALVEAGRHEEAVECFEEAVERAPRWGKLRYHYGLFLHATGRRVQSLEHLAQAVALEPRKRAWQVVYARALEAAGRTEEAAAVRRRIVERGLE